MATRPVFLTLDTYPWVQSEMITFDWIPGMTKIEKQANIETIHKQAQNLHPQIKLLEVSSKSTESLGKTLSAFNLQVHPTTFNLASTSSYLSVECIYQSSKVFEYKGERKGPFLDLLTVTVFTIYKSFIQIALVNQASSINLGC